MEPDEPDEPAPGPPPPPPPGTPTSATERSQVYELGDQSSAGTIAGIAPASPGASPSASPGSPGSPGTLSVGTRRGIRRLQAATFKTSIDRTMAQGTSKWTKVGGEGAEYSQNFLRYAVSTLPRDLFRDLDVDGNGSISLDEFKEMVQLLKTKVPVQRIFDEMLAMQSRQPVSVPPSEVGFDAFVSTYNNELGSLRRENRPSVKENFERIQGKNENGIDKLDFGMLVKRCKRKLLLLPPEFQLEKDWSIVVQGRNVEIITFPEFEHVRPALQPALPQPLPS